MRAAVIVVAILALGAMQADARGVPREVQAGGLVGGFAAQAMTCAVAGIACLGGNAPER